MLLIFYCLCFWTCLVAGLPKAASEDCVPDAYGAPYGITKRQYSTLYTAVQDAHVKLVVSGCSLETLQGLSKCNLRRLADVKPSIPGEQHPCYHELAIQARSLRRALQLYGCIEEEEQWRIFTPAQTVMMFNELETSLAPSTTCSALLKTGRRALADALQGQHTISQSVDSISSHPVPDEEVVPQDDAKEEQTHPKPSHGSPSLWAALIAGALAGLAVDLSLFPLDTIKTRLQSSAGFKAAGGFRGLYQGIGSIALGSAPSSALFFLAYEFAGKKLTQNIGETFVGHLLATTIGEIAASLVRVPADVVKSRQQVDTVVSGAKQATLLEAIRRVYEEGSRPNSRSRIGVFYTGWLSNLVREIPFGCIQFPLFSYLKAVASVRLGGEDLSLSMIAFCGMLAGACAGSLTTPLDVVKTRIMLADRGESGILAVSARILKEEGIAGLFRGVVPRTLWISLGGAIFLGGYAFFSGLIDNLRAGGSDLNWT